MIKVLDFSRRDMKVLRAVLDGRSRAEIACDLQTSEAQVTIIVQGLLQYLSRVRA
jgi:DNA-binding NarL/FixJ family response regulator